jgi:hypothetical protein
MTANIIQTIEDWLFLIDGPTEFLIASVGGGVVIFAMMFTFAVSVSYVKMRRQTKIDPAKVKQPRRAWPTVKRTELERFNNQTNENE